MFLSLSFFSKTDNSKTKVGTTTDKSRVNLFVDLLDISWPLSWLCLFAPARRVAPLVNRDWHNPLSRQSYHYVQSQGLH